MVIINELQKIVLKWIGMILSISVLSFAVQAANGGPTSMTKRDLAKDGLLLLLPQDPAYADELTKLQFEGKPGMDVARPDSVILKNNTNRALAAFALRWKIADPTGFLRTRDVMQLEPMVLLDGGVAKTDQALIPAGASRLVTIEGLILRPESLKDFSSEFLQPGFSPKSVQLDFAVFDDGEIVGPDEIGLLPTFKATFDAKQDLMEEISAQLSQGKSLDAILNDLKKTSAPAPTTHAPLDPVSTYASLRQQYLDELITTDHNFGEQRALQSLRRHKYKTRPNIHRRDSAALNK